MLSDHPVATNTPPTCQFLTPPRSSEEVGG